MGCADENELIRLSFRITKPQSLRNGFIRKLALAIPTVILYTRMSFRSISGMIPQKQSMNMMKYRDYFCVSMIYAKECVQNGAKLIGMESPVNHINVKRESRMRQVETGPLFFPVLDEIETSSKHLLPSFGHK